MTILLFSSVSARSYEGAGGWQAYYNAEIRNNGLEHYDEKRIKRLKDSYNLDWYLEYCGDPTAKAKDLSKMSFFARKAEKKLQKKCRVKLDNLSEQEARSLVIYKTNFAKVGQLDPRINAKILEMIEDVRKNQDKGKYGYLSDFIYSDDVLFGIIFMEQNNISFSEYKRAYYGSREIENARQKALKEKYDIDWIKRECGDDNELEEYIYCSYEVLEGHDQCTKEMYNRICEGNFTTSDIFCSCAHNMEIFRTNEAYKSTDTLIGALGNANPLNRTAFYEMLIKFNKQLYKESLTTEYFLELIINGSKEQINIESRSLIQLN